MTCCTANHRERRTMRHSVAVTLCSAALLGAGFLAGCSKTRQAHAPLGSLIGSPVSYPTSAAYEPQTGSLIVGSYADGSLARVPLAHEARHARAPALPLDGRQNVLRVRVDGAHARLWVLASDAIYVYDTATSRLLARVPVDEMGQHSSEHCLADMALDPDGNAFVSSAMRPLLMRVDARTFESRRHLLQPDADADKDFGLSALAFAGGTLYAASAGIGKLWKLDYEGSTALQVEISQPIFGACALHAIAASPGGNRQPVLYVAGGFRDGMKRIDLARSGPSRVSAVRANGAANVPTDFAIVDHDLYIMSSRLAEHPDFDRGDGISPSRFSIVRIAAP